MLDQKVSNNISKIFGMAFIFLGMCVSILGISLVFSDSKGTFENTLMIVFLASGALMVLGGFQAIKKSKEKDKDIALYEEQINRQLIDPNNKDYPESGKSHSTIEEKGADVYKPDIIAKWEYSLDEWKLMGYKETRRRLQEGIWVTLAIALFGGWFISLMGETFLFGFLFALGVGIAISLLKVVVANNLFSTKIYNTLVITTNALIINGKFKIINDENIKLEYVKSSKIDEKQFIEFSLQWMTRSGATNDQIRVFVPLRYQNEVQKVLDYYRNKGVSTLN